MSYVAVHQIESRVKGVSTVTAPGKPYEPADAKERDSLLARGAIRWAAKRTPAPAPTAEPVSSTTDDHLELENMTKAQLIKFADDNQIEVNKGGSKSDILAEIAESGKGEDLV